MAISTGAKVAGAGFCLGYLLSVVGAILVLCGLAAMQKLCHEDGPVITNSRRRLLQIDPDVLFAACSKAYRFQWCGWALQTTFCTLVAAYWCAKFKHTGVMIIGGTITVLAMIFANETLQASDDTSGQAFSRATLTFVGWLLTATGNFLLMLTSSHIESESSAALPTTTISAAATAVPPTAAAEKKQEAPAASAGSATLAVTAA